MLNFVPKWFILIWVRVVLSCQRFYNNVLEIVIKENFHPVYMKGRKLYYYNKLIKAHGGKCNLICGK